MSNNNGKELYVCTYTSAKKPIKLVYRDERITIHPGEDTIEIRMNLIDRAEIETLLNEIFGTTNLAVIRIKDINNPEEENADQNL